MKDYEAIALINDYIDTSYFNHKVCEGCDSIILSTRIFCPACDSYRFDTSYKRISKRVNELIDEDRDSMLQIIEAVSEEYNQ